MSAAERIVARHAAKTAKRAAHYATEAAFWAQRKVPSQLFVMSSEMYAAAAEAAEAAERVLR